VCECVCVCVCVCVCFFFGMNSKIDKYIGPVS
jgi:hypothetical protein